MRVSLALLALLAWLPSAAAQDHALSAAASEMASPASEEPAGLLLGLRSGDDYSTLFLTVSDGSVAVRRYPWLVSAQADGFRYLDGATATAGPGCPGPGCRFTIADIWVGRTPAAGDGFAAPLREEMERYREEAAADPRGEHYDYSMTRRIVWIANGAACLSHELHGFRGGAHGFAEYSEHCLPIDPPRTSWDEREPLPLEASGLDRAARRAATEDIIAHIRAGRFEELTLSESDRDDYLASQSLQRIAFRLDRAGGRTMATAAGYIDAPYVVSPTYELTATAAMGPAGDAVSPYNPPLPVWDRLRELNESVRDAFLSPTGNALFVLTEDELIGLEPGSGRLLYREAVEADAVVSADWAVGGFVARWADAIARP